MLSPKKKSYGNKKCAGQNLKDISADEIIRMCNERKYIL
jgi:hypothetical protein